MATSPSENAYDVPKRVLDTLLSGAALVALALPIIALAIVVRLSLGSPVFFRQKRVGRGERVFTLVKFRSMRDLRDAKGVLLPDAERMTPLGRVMRRTSLDELPGLWNVLVGDMSLVGPRPLLVDYLPYYTVGQSRRHEIRPGVTGLAQVSGRNAMDWDTRLRLDIDYVEQRSFSLDLRILIQTLSKVLQGEGVENETDLPMPRFDDEVRAGRANGRAPTVRE